MGEECILGMLKEEARQVNSSNLKKGNIGITNMHKSTGDKIGIPDGHDS